MNDKTLGFKYDSEKPRVDLVPYDALMEIAKVFTKASDDKYPQRNWEHGMEWHRIFNSTMRHMYAFWQGEDIDSEFGLSHLAHAGCNILMLLGLYLRNVGIDDRPGKTSKKFEKVENDDNIKDLEDEIVSTAKKAAEDLTKFITNNNEVKTVKEKNNSNIPVSLKDSFKIQNWNIDVEYNRNNKQFSKNEEYIYNAQSDDGLYKVKFTGDKKLTAAEILDILNRAINNEAIANDKKDEYNNKNICNGNVEDVKFSYYFDGKHSYNIKRIKSGNTYNYKFEFYNDPKNAFSYISDHELTKKEMASIIKSNYTQTH